MYDYMLGGTHDFQIDRDATEQFKAQMPDLGDAAWANRGFHGRAASWLATEHGIRQFVDIRSGLPTQSNTHEVLHTVAPDASVVYIDSDPMVLVLAKELLTEDGATAVIQADLREPDAVLSHPRLRALIDFAEPVGLLMTAVLQFVADESDPRGLVARYVAALCPGSYLALSHITRDKLPPMWGCGARKTRPRPTATGRARSTAGSPAARDLRGVPFPPVSTGSPMCRHALVPERFRGKVPGYLAPGRLNVPTG